jgi:hypothetical protein
LTKIRSGQDQQLITGPYFIKIIVQIRLGTIIDIDPQEFKKEVKLKGGQESGNSFEAIAQESYVRHEQRKHATQM